MTNNLDKFVALTSKAVAEVSPRVDVRSRVLATISTSAIAASADRIAIRFLVGSVSLALVAMTVFTIFAIQEPPVEMIIPFVSRLP